MDCEATGIVYRVLDSEGNVLKGWSEMDQEKSSSGALYPTFGTVTDSAILNAIQSNFPEATHNYSFRGYANLKDYVGESVTVEFALISTDDVHGEHYYTIATAVNVKPTN